VVAPGGRFGIRTAQVQIAQQAIQAIQGGALLLTPGPPQPTCHGGMAIGMFLELDPFLEAHRFSRRDPPQDRVEP
jgi:hypothetical protein